MKKGNRLMAIEVANGEVSHVSFDTGDALDVEVVIIDHDSRQVSRWGMADNVGAEGVIQYAKMKECPTEDCGAHGYTDEEDCAICGNVVVEDEIVWYNPETGRLDTEKGDPYCVGCVPNQEEGVEG